MGALSSFGPDKIEHTYLTVELKCASCGHIWKTRTYARLKDDGSVDEEHLNHVLKSEKTCCPECQHITYKIIAWVRK